MKKYLYLLFSAIALNSGLVEALNPKPKLIVATGDSYTRRTGECKSSATLNQQITWQECWDQTANANGAIDNKITQPMPPPWMPQPKYITPYINGANINQVSYANYLNAASLYTVAPVVNSARGGETCDDPKVNYDEGIFKGQPKSGLLAQVESRINNHDVEGVSLLLGVNDVLELRKDKTALQKCLSDLIASITVKGKYVILMTYPPVSDASNPWGENNGANGLISDVVNPAIRAAAQAKSGVYLAETSGAWAATPNAITNYTSDGAHPNALGAWKLAREWAKKVCGGTTTPPIPLGTCSY